MDDSLEPEEPDSDQERAPSDDERQAKRRRKAPPVPADGYPGHLWHGLEQGKAGFNAAAKRVLHSILAGPEAWKAPTQGDVALMTEELVSSVMLHPKSPIQRVLLDHNTGSGKTLIMLRALDNYFFDPRAKIVIVPKDNVLWNFYSSLWEWPSRWRDYACQQHPEAAAMASGTKEWRSRRHARWAFNSRALTAKVGHGVSLQAAVRTHLLQPMRDCLEMKRAFYNGKVRRAFVDKRLWQRCLSKGSLQNGFRARVG